MPWYTITLYGKFKDGREARWKGVQWGRDIPHAAAKLDTLVGRRLRPGRMTEMTMTLREERG